jgi:hypothetical protein
MDLMVCVWCHAVQKKSRRATVEDNNLVESSVTATINVPIEQVDIPSWCFTLRESEISGVLAGSLLGRRDNGA